MRTVIWARSAERDLSRLTPGAAGRIINAIYRFATTGQGDVQQRIDADGDRWLRVRDWRVIFEPSADTITDKRILPRGRAYRE